MNRLLREEVGKHRAEQNKQKSGVRESSPETADFINLVKSKFGLQSLLVEIDGREIYRAGNDRKKQHWDGKLRPCTRPETYSWQAKSSGGRR